MQAGRVLRLACFCLETARLLSVSRHIDLHSLETACLSGDFKTRQLNTICETMQLVGILRLREFCCVSQTA